MNVDGQSVPENIEDSEISTQNDQIKADPILLELEATKRERDALKDQLLRVMAEAQNVQKRLRSQMEEDRKFAALPFVEKLLPVLDSFDRSLSVAEKGASLESLIDGLKAIQRQLIQTLESVHVTRIESVGATYNAEFHEALLTQDSLDLPEDTITDEIESGYLMNGRVIRPAKVRVSKRP